MHCNLVLAVRFQDYLNQKRDIVSKYVKVLIVMTFNMVQRSELGMNLSGLLESLSGTN